MNQRVEQSNFNVGDLVIMDSWNMKSKRPTKKLDYNKIGPFKVVQLIGKQAYKVELSPQVRIHSTFHVPILESHQKICNLDCQQSPSSANKIKDKASYVVSQVVDNMLKVEDATGKLCTMFVERVSIRQRLYGNYSSILKKWELRNCMIFANKLDGHPQFMGY